jgi:predicted transcriptional regulator
MTDQDLVDLIKALSEDVRQIRSDMARLARDSYRQDLEKVANTPIRQEIWRLCDGDISSEEISKKIGVTLRTVQYFVQDAEKKGLIISQRRGYPKRNDSYDEVPAEWKPYKKPDVPIAASDQGEGGNPNE